MKVTTNRKDLADSIRRRIQNGEWAPGERLPSTAQLAEEYGVGQSTVFNAMSLLKHEGIVTAMQGGRRYVAEGPAPPPES